MKIRKLLTLSQYIDFINDKIIAEGEDRFATTRLDQIRDYNNFLKQPLSKEMFVNTVKYPTDEEWKFKYDWACEQNTRWQEVEKKVLFEGNLTEYNYFIVNDYHIKYKTSTNKWVLWYHNKNKRGFAYINDKIETLNDLAEAAKGELTLKNVEL